MHLPRGKVKDEREDVRVDKIIESYESMQSDMLMSIGSQDFSMVDGFLAGINSILSDYGELLEDYITPEFITCVGEYMIHNEECDDATEIFRIISASDSLPDHLAQAMLSCRIFQQEVFMEMGWNLQNEVIDLLGNLLDAMPEPQRDATLNFIYPLVLTRAVSSDPGEAFRFIYTLVCGFSEYFGPEEVASLKGVIMSMEDNNENLFLIFHSLFRLLNETTYTFFFLDDAFCVRCGSLIPQVEAKTLSSLLICFSKFAELLPEGESAQLQRINIAEIIAILTATMNDPEYASVRVDALQLLINASACDEMGPVILSIPNIIDFLQYEIRLGSYHEISNAIFLYNNLIDRNNITRRIEMSTNAVMKDILHVISSIPDHNSSRKIVKTLLLTIQKAAAEGRAEEFRDFLKEQWDSFDVIMKTTQSKKLSEWIEQLETAVFDE